MEKTKIVLTDLDGVLVRPGGYRAAVTGSLETIIRRMGLDAPAPTELVPALFESVGITSEWDMVPLSVAILLNAAARQAGEPLPALDLDGLMAWMQARQFGPLAVEYENSVRALRGLVNTRVTPAFALYQMLLSGGLKHVLPHLNHQPFVRDLLEDTRDPAHSLTMRLVQSHVLGAQIFEQTYGLPAEVPGESTLLALDRPVLDAGISRRLRALHRDGVLRLCAFTARPSLPPADGGFSAAGYSPEAELALQLVGMRDMPLMGYGRLIAYGNHYGVPADSVLKPAPLQSLAAALAAVTGQEWAALQWAHDFLLALQSGQPPALPHGLPRALDLHVFEDASVGIQGGRAAVDLLRSAGLDVTYNPWGIATITDKEAALRAAGAPVYPDVNAAMRAAFGALLEED